MGRGGIAMVFALIFVFCASALFLSALGSVFSPKVALVFLEVGGAEYVHFPEELVDDVDPAVFVDGDAGGEHVAGGARDLAAVADEHQQAALSVEDLKVAEGGIGDVDVAFGIGGDALGARELAAFPAHAAEGQLEVAVPVEGLYAEIAAVGYIDRAVRRGGYLQGEVEVAFFPTAGADGL